MKDQLFDIPESLSPRLKWMREHGASVKETRTLLASTEWLNKGRFAAWFCDNDEYVPDQDQEGKEDTDMHRTGEPDDISQCGFGGTEDEALDDLCRVTGTKHWNQP